MLRKLLRIISVFLAIIVCASAVSCDLPSKTPIEQGYEIISIIDEKMNSDKLASMYGMYSISADAFETLEALRSADYTGEATVYQLYMPRDAYFEKLFGADVSQDDFSETLYNSLTAISASMIAHTIDNNYKAVVVSSMISYDQTFVDSSIDEDLLYLYVFNSGAPIIVSMHPSGNGAVTASGCLIISDEFNTTDKESIERSFSHFGYEGVTAKKVS